MSHSICCAQADPRGKDGNRYRLSGHAASEVDDCATEPAAYADCMARAHDGPCRAYAITLLRHDDPTTKPVPVCEAHLDEHWENDLWVYLTPR